jgi:predicted enzyme related to lactoylglutathione lyase
MNINRLLSHVFRLCAIMLLLSSPAWAAPQLPPLNDPPSGVSLPGKFTWFDMATPVMETQQEFYTSVFGWTYRSPARTDDDYTLIMNRGRAIGGMFRFEPPGGEQDGAAWIVLMSVENPDETERVVKSAGGSVDIAPTAVPGRGRHALFRDPADALFGVLKSDSGDPPDEEVGIGAFLWVDLFARDEPAMTAFYSKLAPYETEDREITEQVNRTLLIAGGMPRASIVPVDEEANRAAWVPYVRVENVEATLEKVVAGGGFAIIPPDQQLLDGNVAVFVDPHGGVTGIVKWDYDREEAQ